MGTAPNGLAYPRLRVVMADDAEWQVQPIGPDQIRFELTASKHKWPPFTDTPVLWQTFLAWTASRREGLLPTSVTWEEFRDTGHRYVQAAPTDDEQDQADDEDGLGPDDVRPTRPGPGTG
jgi:hypothetical protein